MTFVVTDNCIGCKYTDCVEVCPVDCFHEGMTMLVIDPETCIDCGACVPECPAEAIFPDSYPDLDKSWIELNSRYALDWPNVTRKSAPLVDADANNGVAGKFDSMFDARPAGER